MPIAPDELTTLSARIRADAIGDDQPIQTPYGWLRLTYADHTASGRALGIVEDTIRRTVLPSYGNTHTDGSYTGRRSTELREEARARVRSAVEGDDSTAVIFCGTGSTGAIDKFIAMLGLRVPGQASDSAPRSSRPLVLIGPYEHHSNELSWRESAADVVAIGADRRGHPDLAQLESELCANRRRPLLIGSFSAASNVTGIITDNDAITALLHRFGALACWDCAASSAHLPVGMAVPGRPPKDAAFLSPHKLPGGPGTPGVLAIRRDLATNAVPTLPGGGTVSFVSPTRHHYVKDVETREEAGTPDIIGAIRAGLVFRLRELVGVDAIAAHEQRLVQRLVGSLSASPGITVLGETREPRIGLVSFLVDDPQGPEGRRLHHDFVVAVLSDLFGIQARGGCSCAGPLGHRLLGIDADTSAAFERQVLAGYNGIKPGWVRLSVCYYMSDEVVAYLGEAVGLIARFGHRLLPAYTFDLRSGRWAHRAARPAEPALGELLDDRLAGGGPILPGQVGSLDDQLDFARGLLTSLPESTPETADEAWPAEAEALRWFRLPAEIRQSV